MILPIQVVQQYLVNSCDNYDHSYTLYYAHTTWREQIMNENKIKVFITEGYTYTYYYAIILCTNTINKSRNVNLGLWDCNHRMVFNSYNIGTYT